MSIYDHHNGSIVANAAGGVLDVTGRVGARIPIVAPNDCLSATLPPAQITPGTILPALGGNWSGEAFGNELYTGDTWHTWPGFVSFDDSSFIFIDGQILDTCVGYAIAGWVFNPFGTAAIVNVDGGPTVNLGYEPDILAGANKYRLIVTVPGGCSQWSVTADWVITTTGVEDVFMCIVCDPSSWKFSVYQGNLARTQWNAYHSTPGSSVFEDWHFATACPPSLTVLGSEDDTISELRIFNGPITEADAQDLWNIA